ncbi:BLUF domain-containing protein [Rhizobium rhizophilum]|uniref:BLUF domain-containing protein n=1 Tax=Rhizobium rhizophilum TaxID=1850373 RepID=A0ABY2QXF6_9HYPH|nr:BLUF domain-containing protein [Rhizobium rhizophilum]THV15767.1 BLUF domain-containing protein [Rhizobium rhizophilum]
MDVFRAIYTSQPFGYDSTILSGILMEARRANVRDGITGALICRADIYLQWLEGPELQVLKALERIERDDRHLDVKVHVAEHVAERAFGEWAMLHDPAATWIWTQSEIADGALERTTPAEVTDFFLRLRSSANGKETPSGAPDGEQRISDIRLL